MPLSGFPVAAFHQPRCACASRCGVALIWHGIERGTHAPWAVGSRRACVDAFTAGVWRIARGTTQGHGGAGGHHGSRAHAKMLAKQGITSGDDAAAIDAGLEARFGGDCERHLARTLTTRTSTWPCREGSLTADTSVARPRAPSHRPPAQRPRANRHTSLCQRFREEFLEGNELRQNSL